MGSAAKILLAGATAIVVGIYSVGLNKAQLTDVLAADILGRSAQIDNIAEAAFRVVVYRVQKNVSDYRPGNMSALNFYSASPRTTLGGGGTYTYEFWVPYGSYNATATVTLNLPGQQVKTYNLEIKKVYGTGGIGTGTRASSKSYVRGQWQLTRQW